MTLIVLTWSSSSGVRSASRFLSAIFEEKSQIGGSRSAGAVARRGFRNVGREAAAVRCDLIPAANALLETGVNRREEPEEEVGKDDARRELSMRGASLRERWHWQPRCAAPLGMSDLACGTCLRKTAQRRQKCSRTEPAQI